LVKLIGVCAIVLALIRSPAAPPVVAVGIALPGFLIGRARGGAGILGGATSAGLVCAGWGIAMYVYAYFFPEPGPVLDLGPLLTIPVLSAYGLIWGAAVGIAFHLLTRIGKSRLFRPPSTQDACGPITWRGFDG
jgi:hypothetical protein